MSGAQLPPSGADAPTTTRREQQADDLHIEVSDLRRPSPGAGAHAPWYRQRVQVPRLLVAATLVVLLSLIVVVATPLGATLRGPGVQPTPTQPILGALPPTALPATPTPSPYPTATLIAPAIGSFPANCPPGAPLVAFAPNETYPGVGGSDVWVIGLFGAGARSPASGQHAAAQLGALRPSDYTPLGWPVQVQLFIKQGFTQTITLTGHDLRTGYPLWLSPNYDQSHNVSAATPRVTIDLGQILSGGQSTDGQWAILFGVLYLPGAGCYALQANWPGGGWVVNFAAGR